MHFPDSGPTTYRETVYVEDAEPSSLKESHFDRFAISKNIRLMFTYYPERTANAATKIGTILNGDIGDENPPGGINIPLQSSRISNEKGSCPPVLHNYPINNQYDRLKYLYSEMVACHPSERRLYKPNLDRSRDLSDHLPVTFTYTKDATEYQVATWNMASFDPTINPKNDKDAKDFSSRKEITKADKFTKILDVFQIVAVQELKQFRRIKENAKDAGANAKCTKDVIMNKRWYWSTKTTELGFAVNDKIRADNCKDISVAHVKGLRPTSRSAFMCDFYLKKTVRLSLYVL